MGETSTEICGAEDLHPDAVPSKKGDVNMDGIVNVSDVTALISYILGNEVSPFNESAAYVNDDSTVNVADVTLLISMVLNN